MKRHAFWSSAFLLALSFASVFVAQSFAQVAYKVVKAYKTEQVPHPQITLGDSQIVLVVQANGFSDAEWGALREAYVLADSTKAALLLKGIGQSSKQDGKVVTTQPRELIFIIPKAASTFELQFPSRPPTKFQVPAAIVR